MKVNNILKRSKARKTFAIITALMTCMFMFAGCGTSGGSADADAEEAVAEQDIDLMAHGDPLKITCSNGGMVGRDDGTVSAFLGVPYAEQPVGDLRWKAPVPAADSDEDIDCGMFGHTALQYEWPTEPASSTPKGEDCLTLNIWSADGDADIEKTDGKNVMVFFHGGAYGWGGTTDPMYNGYNFAKANSNTIIVTCNYRLGLMGFADFSQIPGGEGYTDINLAIRDHVCALQWIKKNIANFGGNPDNITIFGESAGGWSVSALLVSPLSKGLFNRAIIESGGLPVKEREDAQEFAKYICESAECETMDELQEISTKEWLKIEADNWIADECCGLVYDGEVIPEESEWDAALKDKINDGVSVLMGANSDEWNYFKEDAEGDTDEERFDNWHAEMNELWHDVYEDCNFAGKNTMDELYKTLEAQVPEEYAQDKTTKDAITKSKFCTESWRLDHTKFADRYVDLGGTVYMYYWDVPSTMEEYYKSAVHAVELANVFNNVDDGIYAGEVDKDVAGETQAAWILFAATGDPSVGANNWTPYTKANRETMKIQKGGWEMANDPMGNVREMLDSVDAYDLLW